MPSLGLQRCKVHTLNTLAHRAWMPSKRWVRERDDNCGMADGERDHGCERACDDRGVCIAYRKRTVQIENRETNCKSLLYGQTRRCDRECQKVK
jgi:hypothetical protein